MGIGNWELGIRNGELGIRKIFPLPHSPSLLLSQSPPLSVSTFGFPRCDRENPLQSTLNLDPAAQLAPTPTKF